jgi:hypothetical protein
LFEGDYYGLSFNCTAKLIILFHLSKPVPGVEKVSFCKVLGINHLENSIKLVEKMLLILINILKTNEIAC